MEIHEATRQYEAWLAERLTLIRDDLELKHEQMAAGVFPFLRATFYRWAQVWPQVCKELNATPAVLSVGDLHVENFGTWRDSEGRLIWGINDFDEAYPLPYANDLVRLVASAFLALHVNRLSIAPRPACAAILDGYMEYLQSGGEPFVLADEHIALREMATGADRDPIQFWQRLEAMPTTKEDVPTSAVKALEARMPNPGLPYRIVHRIAGLGSLGRQRYVAIARWHGGKIAREVKGMTQSACVWARRNDRRFPIDTRPLKRRALDFNIEVVGADV